MIGLDSTFVIDHFKMEPGTKQVLATDEEFALCEPVIFEFLCGSISERTKRAVEEFALPLKTFSVERTAARAAAEIFREQKAKGSTIRAFDALIAGTYMANGIRRIATRNAKHFEGIAGLEVIGY